MRSLPIVASMWPLTGIDRSRRKASLRPNGARWSNRSGRGLRPVSPRSIRAMAHLAARACFFARTGCRRFDLHCRGDRRVHAMSRAAGGTKRRVRERTRPRDGASPGPARARRSGQCLCRMPSPPLRKVWATAARHWCRRAKQAHGAPWRRIPHDILRVGGVLQQLPQFDAALAVNGKPLENTVAEWQASPQASQGVTCQTCHMPDRQHLWRGIHDPAMVASGLTTHITADAAGVRFEITNTGVGHAFPTYVTPKVVMYAQGLDPAGSPQPEALRTHVIARDVRADNERWIEVSDSRLLPGQSAAIELPWNASERIQVWLQVIPDNFYETEIYPDRLARASAGSAAAQLIMQAEAAAANRTFRLFETELGRP